ncbi:MAG: PTS sugar transporter subunit IIA, partial [Vibrio sp.]
MLKDLLCEDLICLDLSSKTKAEVLNELADMLDAKGYICDKQLFLNDVWQRESLGSTGFEDGIA